MKYVTVAEMIAIEKEANTKGHTYSEMMEHAGRGLAIAVNDVYGFFEDKCILGLVGSGNNGGDALVAFEYLQELGWQSKAYIIRSRPDDDHLLERARSAGCEIIEIKNDPEFQKLSADIKTHAVLLDGVLGTGIRLPLRGVVRDVLDNVRRVLATLDSPPHVVAVDCPSGIDCDTGEIATESVPAEMTVTMAAIKQGLLKFPAFNLVGNLRGVGIGLPDGLDSYDSLGREVLDINWVRDVLPSRPLDSHKGTFGVVMVLAGSINYSGAVVLAGEAAFRSGTGWVTLAVPEPIHAALAGSFIEATWLPLPHKNGWIASDASKVLLDNMDRVTTLLVGPGFGVQETTGDCLSKLLCEGKTILPSMVVDADGLKLLAGISGWTELLPAPAVLTPHPGEMAVLTGTTIDEVASDRVGIAEKYAHLWGHVVVLKGAFTVIASPDGRTAIIPVATPALARAGTGDVLAGLIAGLRGQGLSAYHAASAGAWIHANAGLQAAEKFGSSAAILAGDVLAAVVDVISDVGKK